MGVSENNFAEATLLLALVLQKVDRDRDDVVLVVNRSPVVAELLELAVPGDLDQI